MSEKSNKEIVEENIKLMRQTEKLIKLVYIVLFCTIIAYTVLILLKIGVI